MNYDLLGLNRFFQPQGAPVSSRNVLTQKNTPDSLFDRGSMRTMFIQDLAVTSAKIQDLAVTTAKISDLAVTNAKISSLSASKITAGTIDASTITVTNLNATNLTTGTLSIDRIADTSITNAKIANLNATKINAGDIASARMSANVLTALQVNVNNLSAITADIGSITSGSITGVTITGGTVRTASSGARIVLDAGNFLTIYNAAGTNIGGLAPTSGVILADGLWSFVDDISFANISTEDITVFGGVSNLDWVGSATNKRIQFDQSGRIQITDDFDPSSASDYSLGGNDRYWVDVHCENVVDHSMGFYDDGFTDENGNKITDIEALLKIAPHPTRKMKNGRSYLDKRSFPKEFLSPAYNKASKEFYPRDEEDRPYTVDEKTQEKVYVDGYDGVSLGQVTALLIGSVKELNKKIDTLEKGLAKT